MTNQNKALYVVFCLTCFLAGYGAFNSYLTKQYIEKELVNLYNNDKQALEMITEVQKDKDYTPVLEKIVTHIEKKDSELKSLQEDFNFMLKDYAELRFPGEKPEGLYTEFGLFDVIGQD